MSAQAPSTTAGPYYRLDTFVVPAAARDEFLQRVRETHELLETQPGFLQDRVLERSTGDGNLNIVTLVEWENEAAMAGARTAVVALRARTGFDPKQMFDALGIRAELADYRRAGI